MGEYDDLIYLPHPVSRKHPPMSAMDRAAQFSPFSALTGYEADTQLTSCSLETPPKNSATRSLEFVFIKKTPFVQCGRALWAHYKSSAYYHNILCVRWLDYFWKISEP